MDRAARAGSAWQAAERRLLRRSQTGGLPGLEPPLLRLLLEVRFDDVELNVLPASLVLERRELDPIPEVARELIPGKTRRVSARPGWSIA